MKLKYEETIYNHLTAMKSLVSDLDSREFALVGLSRGLFAVIDPDMSDEVTRFKWHANVQPEHVHAQRQFNQKPKTLGRYIAELSMLRSGKTKAITHVSNKNKLTLDCRMTNLIFSKKRRGVMQNRVGKRNTSSKYKGVMQRTLDKANNRWNAQIMDKTLGNIYLGKYYSEVEAAVVYDAASCILFGEDGYRNLPSGHVDDRAWQIASSRIETFKHKKAERLQK